MKAIVHRGFGAPSEVLELQDVERPAPSDGEALVEVRAVAVAKGDWLIAQGWPYIARPSYGIRSPRNRIAGLEAAGVVTVVGPGVAGIEVGDEVVGWATGALAEFVAVPVEQLAAKPANASFEQAAAVPVSGFAALQAVRDAAGVSEGSRVLVIGASGGVGSFAVQIAKAFGAEVTGVAGTRNVEFVKRLGADHVIDYTQEEITDGERRFDVIIDIAGNRSLGTLRRALEPKGTLVIVGGSGGKVTMGFGRTIRSIFVSPFVSQKLKQIISKPNRDDLVVLTGMIESGDIIPQVGVTYPLEQSAEAIDLVGSGRSRGKTVITV